MLEIGVIIISISENKCCNHNTIPISPIFNMATAAILDFEKSAIVGAWHHPDLISRGSEDSKTVLTSNTCFFKGVKLGFHLTSKMVQTGLISKVPQGRDGEEIEALKRLAVLGMKVGKWDNRRKFKTALKHKNISEEVNIEITMAVSGSGTPW